MNRLKGLTGCFPAPGASYPPKSALGNRDGDGVANGAEGVCNAFLDKGPVDMFSVSLCHNAEGAHFDPGFHPEG